MKTVVIKTFILLIVLLTAAAFPYRAYAEESVIIDGYSADIPPELEKSLSDAGITPQSIDSEALSVDKVGKHQKPAEITYLADFGSASLQYRKRICG